MTEDELMKDFDPTDEAFSTLGRLLALMRMSSYVLAVYAMLQGSLIIFGGPARFSSRGYVVAMQLPGAPASWGAFLLICGVLSFIGIKNLKYKLASLGMFAAGTWSLGFAIAFLISSVQNPDANLTAFNTYGKDAVLFLLTASASRLLAHTQPRTEE